MRKRTFIVTWQTVVEMNELNDKADIPYAVCVAEQTIRQVILDPSYGDNYFTVQEVTNGPAPKHFVKLDDALEALSNDDTAFKESWDTYWAELDDAPVPDNKKES